MRITKDQLCDMEPCDLERRLALFGDQKTLTAKEALERGATVDDVLWVLGRLGTPKARRVIAEFAIFAAEQVQHLNPDPRVSAAIVAAKADAAWDARVAGWDAWDAKAAARAAADAARDAARVAGWVAADAARVAASDAARAAADAAGNAAWDASVAWDARVAARAAQKTKLAELCEEEFELARD